MVRPSSWKRNLGKIIEQGIKEHFPEGETISESDLQSSIEKFFEESNLLKPLKSVIKFNTIPLTDTETTKEFNPIDFEILTPEIGIVYEIIRKATLQTPMVNPECRFFINLSKDYYLKIARVEIGPTLAIPTNWSLSL